MAGRGLALPRRYDISEEADLRPNLEANRRSLIGFINRWVLRYNTDRSLTVEGGITTTDTGYTPSVDEDFATKGYVDSLPTFTTYTPTLTAATTNPTNYTGSGEYARIGPQLVWFSASITMDSGFTGGTGLWRVSLPFTGDLSNQVIAGMGRDSGSSNEYAINGRTSSNLITALSPGDGGSRVSATVPFTWANGDFLWFTGVYKAVV